MCVFVVFKLQKWYQSKIVSLNYYMAGQKKKNENK